MSLRLKRRFTARLKSSAQAVQHSFTLLAFLLCTFKVNWNRVARAIEWIVVYSSSIALRAAALDAVETLKQLLTTLRQGKPNARSFRLFLGEDRRQEPKEGEVAFPFTMLEKRLLLLLPSRTYIYEEDGAVYYPSLFLQRKRFLSEMPLLLVYIHNYFPVPFFVAEIIIQELTLEKKRLYN